MPDFIYVAHLIIPEAIFPRSIGRPRRIRRLHHRICKVVDEGSGRGRGPPRTATTTLNDGGALVRCFIADVRGEGGRWSFLLLGAEE